MTEALWRQREAAAFLRVSVGYLRRSSCPKILLPSNRSGGKPMLRYDPAEVRVWYEARKLRQIKRAG